jgi:hypothetical protein
MDPNSFAFMSLANQQPGYYTPTPGGMNTLYHSPAAGDLHAPALGINLATPMSMPNPISGPLPVDPTAEMNLHFQHQFLPQQFQNLNPFTQQAAFAPNTFMHPQDSGYDSMDRSAEDSSMDDVNMQVNPLHVMPAADYSEQMDIHSPVEGEK